MSLIQFHLLESYKFANFGRETVRSLAGVGRSSILEQKHVVARADDVCVLECMQIYLALRKHGPSVRPISWHLHCAETAAEAPRSGREGLGREGRSAAEPAIHN